MYGSPNLATCHFTFTLSAIIGWPYNSNCSVVIYILFVMYYKTKICLSATAKQLSLCVTASDRCRGTCACGEQERPQLFRHWRSRARRWGQLHHHCYQPCRRGQSQAIHQNRRCVSSTASLFLWFLLTTNPTETSNNWSTVGVNTL